MQGVGLYMESQAIMAELQSTQPHCIASVTAALPSTRANTFIGRHITQAEGHEHELFLFSLPSSLI